MICSFLVATVTAVLLPVKTFVLYPVIMIKKFICCFTHCKLVCRHMNHKLVDNFVAVSLFTCIGYKLMVHIKIIKLVVNLTSVKLLFVSKAQ